MELPPEQTRAAAPAVPVGDGQTRRAIVDLLCRGSVTAAQIGSALGISAAGVRRHLDVLLGAGEAEAVPAASWQQHGRGRPARRYRLTAAGRGRLGHSYDDLALDAMRALRDVGGDAAVRTFARRRIDGILAGVAPADPTGTAATAEQLAAALNDAGYATTATVPGADRTGRAGVQICQHHCPVSHVAAEFPELCDAEREAFADLLGTHVQRLATIVNGDCACTTHVPAAPAGTRSPSLIAGPSVPIAPSTRRPARADTGPTRAPTTQGAST